MTFYGSQELPFFDLSDSLNKLGVKLMADKDGGTDFCVYFVTVGLFKQKLNLVLCLKKGSCTIPVSSIPIFPNLFEHLYNDQGNEGHDEAYRKFSYNGG